MTALDRCWRGCSQPSTAPALPMTPCRLHLGSRDMMRSQGLTTKPIPGMNPVRPFLLRYPRKLGPRTAHPHTHQLARHFPTLLDSRHSVLAHWKATIGHVSSLAAPSFDDSATLLTSPCRLPRRAANGFAEYAACGPRAYLVRSNPRPRLLYDNQRTLSMRNLSASRSGAHAEPPRSRSGCEAQAAARRLPARRRVLSSEPAWPLRADCQRQGGRHPSPWGDWDSTLLRRNAAAGKRTRSARAFSQNVNRTAICSAREPPERAEPMREHHVAVIRGEDDHGVIGNARRSRVASSRARQSSSAVMWA